VCVCVLVCVSSCVRSRNLNNEAAWDRLGPLRHRKCTCSHAVTYIYHIQRHNAAKAVAVTSQYFSFLASRSLTLTVTSVLSF
jgi:hypothetical protein